MAATSSPARPDAALVGRIVVLAAADGLGGLIVPPLRNAGHDVTMATTTETATTLVDALHPDVVVLDPDVFDEPLPAVVTRLRRSFVNPIVVVSSDQRDGVKVAALDAGADDYVVKPVSVPETLARVRAALRLRTLIPSVFGATSVSVGDVEVDPGAFVARAGGRDLGLTPTQFRLLEVLCRNAGRFVSHAEIERAIGASGGSIGSLRVHVTKLRAKLGSGPDRPAIVTAPGVGYQLRPPTAQRASA